MSASRFNLLSSKSWRLVGCLILIAILSISWYIAGYPLPWQDSIEQAEAYTQGPRMASSTSDCADDASIGTAAWSNPGNATANDGVLATASLASKGGASHYLKCTNFGFTSAMIPSGSTINGIVLGVAESTTVGITAQDKAVRLVKGGVIGTNDRSSSGFWPTTTARQDYGSTTDLWGTTWSASDVTSSTFGAAVSAYDTSNPNSTVANIDYMQITVYFTPPASTITQSAYRLFTNANSTNVGSPLANLNTPISLASAGQAFRLRSLLHIDTNPLMQSSPTLALQFVDQGTGSCATPTGGTPANYTNIGTASGNWSVVNASAAWPVKSGAGATVFNNNLWIMGGTDGSGPDNDVWSSPDGNAWTQQTASAGWANRDSFVTLSYNNKLWVMGGELNSTRYNDVWSSADGITWTRATSGAPWSSRYGLGGAVFNNAMWIMGGNNGTSDEQDVWYSTDGVSWTQATSTAPWGKRHKMAVVVFNNKLWVLGGNSSGYKNDVWSSPDGINWTQETAAAGWSARDSHAAVVHDGKIWVMGGTNGSRLRDVWYSSDGITWTQQASAAEWTARYNLLALSLNNTMYMMAGNSTAGISDDVWQFSPATIIAWNNNSTPASGVALTSNANDPVHGTDPKVNQTYQEANTFTNSVAAIPTGSDGEWDFSLIDNGAPAGTTYCFRIANSDGTAIDSYSVYPQITTYNSTPSPTPTPAPSADVLMRHGAYFLNGIRQPFSF